MTPEARAFGLYIHVPFCAVRCGYCDFNTYTATELGGGASQDEYARTAAREIELSAHYLKQRQGGTVPQVQTVFFGGGTPTLLPVSDLTMLLECTRQVYGLAPDAEVTTEANPDSVTPEGLADLAAAGFTRISFGMQSASNRVLQILDRTHNPDNVGRSVEWARAAGLAVSLDLIYGTPGETLRDWQLSLDEAMAMSPDHISAYALTVEPGTKMGAQVRRGLLPQPDGDDQATKYEMADESLSAAGYRWYEISNWARSSDQECRHNIGYWRCQNWWGIGPGAHGHIDGTRFWNRKHPRPYAVAVGEGELPWQGSEELDETARWEEEVMLGMRLAAGWVFPAAVQPAIHQLVQDGLVQAEAAKAGRLVLTRNGRLLADTALWQLLALAPTRPLTAAQQ